MFDELPLSALHRWKAAEASSRAAYLFEKSYILSKTLISIADLLAHLRLQNGFELAPRSQDGQYVGWPEKPYVGCEQADCGKALLFHFSAAFSSLR